MMMAPYYGHDYVLVTDHHKAVPYLRDLVKLYGGTQCRDVSCINWWVTDMIQDTEGVAKDALAKSRKAMEDKGAEAVILGCTIIAASMEKWLIDTKAKRDLTILNIEHIFAEDGGIPGRSEEARPLQHQPQGYYQKPQQRNGSEFAEVRAKFGRPSALRSWTIDMTILAGKNASSRAARLASALPSSRPSALPVHGC